LSTAIWILFVADFALRDPRRDLRRRGRHVRPGDD
jgi:hypothetical protein